MHDEMGAALSSFKFVTGISTLVILLVNTIVSAAMTMMWRSYGLFRREIKETLRDYISQEGNAKMEMQTEMEQLLKDCHNCEVIIARLQQQIESCQKRCDEWRRICPK